MQRIITECKNKCMYGHPLSMCSVLLHLHYSDTVRIEGSAAVNGHLCDFIAIVWQIDLKELDAKSVKIEGEKHWAAAFSSLR